MQRGSKYKRHVETFVDFLASIDLRTGQFFHEKGRVEWLIK